MARIAGVDVPNNKRVVVALTYIFGIGRSRSESILKQASVDESIRVKDLGDEEIRRIMSVIQNEGGVEGDLQKEIQMNIKRHIEIGDYRGLRHRYGLPVRGQKTKTNARTRKGPRKNVMKKPKRG